MGCHVGCDGVVGSVKLFSKRPAGELSARDVVGAPLPPSQLMWLGSHERWQIIFEIMISKLRYSLVKMIDEVGGFFILVYI